MKFSLTKNQKKEFVRIIVSAILFAAAFFVPYEYVKIGIFLAAYAVVGYDVIYHAVRNIFHGHVLDENFLMGIATVGALALGEFPEAVAVMLFYQVGELFEDYAVNRSRKSIADLMDISPDYADVERDGEIFTVSPEEVKIGEMIVVKAGEKIPLDGTVIEGQSELNTSALTGESLPRAVSAGDNVISGCVNLSGLLKIKVVKEFGESTVSKILELVENASSKKSRAENFITKFARYYTPIVVICALILALIPPLFVGDWGSWIERGLIFLVVSCPCALVISVPLSFFGGIGAASRRGILVKGSNYLEMLSKADTVVFDKTGTLTTGSFAVTEFSEEALEPAAYAEFYSNHPIALSIKEAYGKEIDGSRIANEKEIAGLGLSAEIDGEFVIVGNKKLMEKYSITSDDVDWTAVHVAKNEKYLGYIKIADKIKDEAESAVAKLYDSGVQKIVMLTGDTFAVAKSVAEKIGINNFKSDLLPGDKVSALEEILSDKIGSVAFVGDGINDAPVLARSDIGIAMGALGSDAAIEAADVVLMDDSLSKISDAIRISKKTMRIAKQNIVFALAVKAVVLILAVMGFANLWLAVFADVGVAVIAIINAMRALKF